MSHDPNRKDEEDPFGDDEDFDPFEIEKPWDNYDPFEGMDTDDEAPFDASDDTDAELETPDEEPRGEEWDGDPFDDDPFEIPLEVAPHPHARCAGCGTTWDRIRHDGRAGCAACYAAFREQLTGVMARVQRGEIHVGKTPRAIEKRRLQLEQLRQRRDNQLLVLQSRLQNAVAAEKYEEAAKLRDKIKVVSATIVG